MEKSGTTELIPLSQVRLLDGPFKAAVKANRQYMIALDVDRLLAPFRREAGLAPRKESYANWENIGLDGHTAGHYLSALADMIGSGNDEDGEFSRRLNYMLEELAECQNASADGYLGGIPKSKELWTKVAAGDVQAVRSRWVPWYNVHKTFAGLRDAYLVTNSVKARDLLVRLGDWCDTVTAKLSDAQMQQMLREEHGGMNEVLADIYAITKEEKYLALARRFCHRSVLDPLIQQQDRLTGLHANTQIPKVIGLERIAALTQDEKAHSGAHFFWQTVTKNRSVAFGGNSVAEHFNDPRDFRKLLEHREGPETCNTYNMLRLTEQLFTAEPQAAYADYYERALFNHLLSSINVEHPGFVYFTPIRPAHYRVYSQPADCFWCCVGTGIENPGRYGQFIYAATSDSIYINLFIASELSLPDKGLTLRQETKFPDEEHTRLTVRLQNPKTFRLKFRHPGWVARGRMVVKVNGTPVSDRSTPSNYVSISREWKDDDRIEVDLPMQTTVERLPDQSPWYAILHGPIVLAMPSGTDKLEGLRAGPGRGDHIAHGPLVPIQNVPILVGTADDISKNVVADPKAGPMRFRIRNIGFPESPEGLPLMPFFRLQDSRYQMYWEVTSKETLAARREKMAIEERALLERDAATLDAVAVGEQQPEVDHEFKGAGVDTGIFNGRRWRHGQWFEYVLKTKGARSANLAVTYYGGDADRKFNITANGAKLATVELNGKDKGKFIEKLYSIPADQLPADPNTKVTIRFEAVEGLAGGIFDLRLLKPVGGKN